MTSTPTLDEQIAALKAIVERIKEADRYPAHSGGPIVRQIWVGDGVETGDPTDTDILSALRAVLANLEMQKTASVETSETQLVFGHWSMDQLEEARRIAVDVVRRYGDLVGDEYERFITNPWNDHCSIQAALHAMPKVKP